MYAPGKREDGMSVVELRQYTMVPGLRQDFADLFDREFVETQETLGIELLGQFFDLDWPDRYVWLRRFPDMEARRIALEAFYGGPVWAAHKDAANATMTEWHDVLLLKPASGTADLVVRPGDRAAAGRSSDAGRPMSIVVWDVGEGDLPAFATALRAARPDLRGAFVTDPSANTYPRLPLRDGACVAVAVFDSPAAGPLDVAGRAPAKVLNLAPTARSLLRGV